MGLLDLFGSLGSLGSAAGSAVSPLGVMLGVGSLASGLYQTATQKEINDDNIRFQRETNALQEKMFNQNLDWQRESQQIQNDYNSVAAQVARAAQAGLSPHALLGGAGSSPAGVGSSGSGLPALTAPHAQMVDSPLFNSIASLNGVASAMKSVSDSGLSDAQKQRAISMLQYELEGLKLDNDAKKWSLSLSYKFDDEFKQAEYDLLVSRNALQMSQISLNEELTETQKYEQLNKLEDSMLKHMQKLLTKKEYDIFDKKWKMTFSEVESRIKLNAASARNQNVQADDTIASRQARIKVLNSQAFMQMAQGELSENQSKQILTMLPLIEEAQKLANQATTFTNNVLPQRLKNELNLQYNELKRQKLINEQEIQRLEMLQKENNLYYFKEIVGIMTDIADTAAELMPYKFPKLSSGNANISSKSEVTNVPPSIQRNPIGFGAY